MSHGIANEHWIVAVTCPRCWAAIDVADGPYVPSVEIDRPGAWERVREYIDLEARLVGVECELIGHPTSS